MVQTVPIVGPQTPISANTSFYLIKGKELYFQLYPLWFSNIQESLAKVSRRNHPADLVEVVAKCICACNACYVL